MSEPPAFEEAQRELRSLTAAVEKKALIWLAQRMPPWVNSDHLTALGLLAMLLAGAFYAGSGRRPWLLHLVNLSLAVNWFGDSLDGTLARVRNRTRPRYGFYVDHLVDAFGALFLLVGLALSGLMSERVALALLIVYYLLSINIYLATYALGVFKISYGVLGGTELRILLILGNLLVLRLPYVTIAGEPYRLFDVAGGLSAVILAFVTLRSAIQVTRRLYETERLEPPRPPARNQ